MKLTSSEAAKQLRRLNEELEALLRSEDRCSEFHAALGEDPESVRPSYDFDAVQKQIDCLQTKIRALKHAINVFNSTTEVPGFGMTIDEMLVYLPQLTARKLKLDSMRSVLPKERDNLAGRGANFVIDYRYANYDIARAEAEFCRVSELLARAQTALDVVNTTVSFEADF